ncbi:hypothetical protein AAFF_G00376230 [Aldrovandia affinis]|uniref:protein-serine/threonine phosphatase n=1 Tax=Aldrovandia affinis TaxID=143900 RepID=A0AAD7WLU7_9TELE|nr:hypothetical protein AAFF_G00376230 [Aldrovandia affinis]
MALVTVQRSPTPSATSSPCVSEADSGEEERRSQPRSISESFLTVKGAALFLPRGNGSSPSSVSLVTQRRNKHAGDLQLHLQTMFTLLRPEDSIRLAVRLESAYPQCTRYMVVVSTNGRQDTEESVVLGMDFSSSESSCSVGLVLPLWSDTLIHLDGDGGFSVSTVNRVHVFKPVSVQAMWSALQSLHKACEVARCHNYYPGSLFLTWVSYYQSRVSSDQACINEWNAMQDVQSHRADSPVLFTDVPTERERTERLIKTRLREIMMQKDLENVTSKEIRTELEMQMVCNLREFKEFIDNEMIVILGQMDSPTEIFEHVYLGSEWNASNLEELQASGVRYILNVTREIDNFFPGLFEYHNIRVYDEEATDLLAYWNDTYKFISKAKKAGAKCLVHCKMGVSRSASTVIAYAMKEYGWDLEQAFRYVKQRRAVTKPNPSFMRQLEEYQGILLASKQRHNKLWRSHSDSDLSSERHEPLCKTPHTLGRSDPRNDNNNGPTSLQSFLGLAQLQAPQGRLGAALSESSLAAPPTASTAPRRTSPPPRPAPTLEDPRPQAATAVPEERLRNALLTVAVSLPAGCPHPPPSLTLLPPSPPPPPPPSAQPTLDPPELLVLLLPPPEASSAPCPRRTRTPPRPRSSSPRPARRAPLASPDPKSRPLRCPTEKSTTATTVRSLQRRLCPWPRRREHRLRQRREKFLGLSLEGPAHSPSEQAAAQTPHSKGPSQEMQTQSPPPLALEDPEEGRCKDSAQPEEGGDSCVVVRATAPRAQQENGVSVRHIVTELESISHPATPAQGPPRRREDGEPAAGGAEETPPESPSPPSPPASPSTPPCEWPSGSVRRVTKQLEQRLRQDCPPSPGPAPGPAPALEGVTELETSTDGPLEEREPGSPPTEPHVPPPERTERAGGPDGPRERERAPLEAQRGGVETMEARIRQAGLTLPSLMKRSASLAKLGCLQLDPDDLSDWAPGNPPSPWEPRPPPAPHPHAPPPDALQKAARAPSSGPAPRTAQEPLRTAGSGSPSLVAPARRRGGGSGARDTDHHARPPTPPPLVSVSARQQHGRTHPLRRLKKLADKSQTHSFLYSTM